jgi:hypothetical protein
LFAETGVSTPGSFHQKGFTRAQRDKVSNSRDQIPVSWRSDLNYAVTVLLAGKCDSFNQTLELTAFTFCRILIFHFKKLTRELEILYILESIEVLYFGKILYFVTIKEKNYELFPLWFFEPGSFSGKIAWFLISAGGGVAVCPFTSKPTIIANTE